MKVLWTKKLPLSGENVSEYARMSDSYHEKFEAAKRAAKRRFNRAIRRKENTATKELIND